MKSLAPERDGLWLQVGRAILFFDGDSDLAKAVCRRAIAALTVKDFVKTQQQTWDIVDVYAMKLEDKAGWMMKLYIDKETQVTVISFHPLERPIKTNGGWVRP